jgi:hypothetical protein
MAAQSSLFPESQEARLQKLDWLILRLTRKACLNASASAAG